MADHRGGRPVQVGFYDIERTIGQGNYAVVKLARHRVTKSEVKCEILQRVRTLEPNIDAVLCREKSGRNSFAK